MYICVGAHEADNRTIVLRINTALSFLLYIMLHVCNKTEPPADALRVDLASVRQDYDDYRRWVSFRGDAERGILVAVLI